jgi:hypothetical protein
VRYRLGVLLMLGLLLAACGQGITSSPPASQGTATPRPQVELAEDGRFAQLLGPDDILPIYEPEFVPADQADYDDDELVMGIAIGDEAKAYPVGLLNQREMVNDELAGIPFLVTW